MSPAPAAAASVKGMAPWAKGHPGQAAALAGGFLGLVVLMRARAAKNAQPGSLGYTMPASNTAAAQDVLSSTEGQIANLAQQLQQVNPAPQGWTPPSGESAPGTAYAWNNNTKLSGPGFGPVATNPFAAITDPSGGQFAWISSEGQRAEMDWLGQEYFWQPSPGRFAPVHAAGRIVAPYGVPLFQKVA